MDSPKKIIQFIYGMPVGGAQTVVRNYALELKKRGYNVKILVLYRYPDSVNEKAISEAGIPIIDIFGVVSKRLGFRIKIKIFGRLLAYRKIKKLIREEEPDIIHIHLQLMRYLYPVRQYLNKTGLVYTCHSEVASIFDHSRKGNEEDEKCLRWFIENQRIQIIALHSRMKEELSELLGVDNVITLYNPINIMNIKNPQYSKEEMRRSLGIPQDAYVIGHIGSFSRVKNQKFLLRIFIKCLEKKENAFLLLVGNGPMLSEIKNQINLLDVKSRALILSNRKDIAEILGVMDIFVFPSLHEGLSLALLEAQTAGVPCVISNTISEETICVDNVQSLDLNEGEEQWVKAIYEPVTVSRAIRNDISNFDLNFVLNQLEEIYDTF